MKCNYCNAEIHSEARFCQSCGKEVVTQAQENPEEQKETDKANAEPIAAAEEEDNKKANPIKTVATVIGGLMFAALFVLLLMYQANPDSFGTYETRKAYKYSQEVISQEFYDSSVTKYPRYKSEFVVDNGDIEFDGEEFSLYLVSAYTDVPSTLNIDTMVRVFYTVNIGISKEDLDVYCYEIIKLN